MGNNIRHFRELDVYKYDFILGKLVNMISHPELWTIKSIRENEADYA